LLGLSDPGGGLRDLIGGETGDRRGFVEAGFVRSLGEVLG
jgi:hypothetical protein